MGSSFRWNDGKDAVVTVFVIPAKAGIQSVFDSWYGARLSLESHFVMTYSSYLRKQASRHIFIVEMDSSFRWNDGKDAVVTVFVIPAKAGIQSVFDSWYGARLSLESHFVMTYSSYLRKQASRHIFIVEMDSSFRWNDGKDAVVTVFVIPAKAGIH